MRYATAARFRMALEERIKQRSLTDGVAIQRLRKRLAFERFLARLQSRADNLWFLKGAFALDLRFVDRSRATKDLDLGIYLSLRGDSAPGREEIAKLLRDAAAQSLEDFFVFSVPGEGEEIVQEPSAHAYRFTVRASLADRPFEDFRVDVGAGLELVMPVEEIPESDTLTFAGIVPRRFRAISLAQHFAEKVHALTRPWEDRENTRVKDLVDIILILESSPPEPEIARVALERIFKGRGTHALPPAIPDPPATWVGSYGAEAAEIGLTHANIEDATNLLREYWSKIVR